MIYRLTNDPFLFPDPVLAEDDGLLAMGGDLNPERLVCAYTLGIFPWFNEDDPILWYSPHERCVIYPDRIRISKSMQKLMRSGAFRFTKNEAFAAVISACAKIPRAGQKGTWIGAEMQSAYIRLFELGIAQSIEVWQEEVLVGGLYGLQINEVFCGESMFSAVSNASKAALICLAQQGDFSLIDCQLPNPHLMSMGAEMISRADYMHILSSVTR